MWLVGRLAPDFKTIADPRKDNQEAIRDACKEFTLYCRELGLFGGGSLLPSMDPSSRRSMLETATSPLGN